MAQTMAEKILARCSGKKDAKAGDIVTATVDCAMMDDILGPRVLSESVRKLGNKIAHPDRVVIICDHYTPPANVNQADIVAFTRKWAEENCISNYFEGQGPCHQILAENGFSLPGTLQVGTDSHTCTGGAFGCFGTGIGSTEMAGVLVEGEIWLRVPESIRINWEGSLPHGVMAKDIILRTIGDIGHAGATYMAMEFTGSTIRELSMDERMCISNMTVEAGAKCGLIAADGKTESYLREHGYKGKISPLYSDPDAEYIRELEYKAEDLVPQIACPHNVDNVKPITEVQGIRIHVAYLGSCTGGRLNDLKAAAAILKDRKIAKDCRLLVSPASKRVWLEADEQGILACLVKAGATILAPTCGACLGVHSGVLAAGENCVSATNRNFNGRMGSRDSYVYLASPATVAASAIEGKLTDPREYY
ncbi:MAG: 3-isopropylmalate dehydratase large subunit [Lutisporaceae bacterium]|jgi:3-isopropylmalate/(R)-2-methylmalate dehydratase large subunit